MRNGVENPPPFSGARIECANVSGSGRAWSLSDGRTDDEQILENDSRRRGRHGEKKHIAIQTFAQIHFAVLAESGNEFSIGGVDGMNELSGGEENPFIIAASPIG